MLYFFFINNYKLSYFYNGHRMGTVPGTDWAPTGHRMDHVVSTSGSVRIPSPWYCIEFLIMCLTRSFVASCFARAATSIPSMSEQVTRVARLATELAEQLSSILLSATRACSHLRWVESCSTFGLRGKRRASMVVVTIAMPHTVPPWRPTFCLGVSNRSMTGREHSLHGT